MADSFKMDDIQLYDDIVNQLVSLSVNLLQVIRLIKINDDTNSNSFVTDLSHKNMQAIGQINVIMSTDHSHRNIEVTNQMDTHSSQ